MLEGNSQHKMDEQTGFQSVMAQTRKSDADIPSTHIPIAITQRNPMPGIVSPIPPEDNPNKNKNIG